jgi:nucleotide-binding universal stress UspA family protein
MKKLKIAIPIDFSEAAFIGARYALMLADNIPAEILLVHVVKPHHRAEPAYGDANVQDRNIAHLHLDEFRTKIITHTHRDVVIKSIVAEGHHLEDTLAALAASEEMDIIIMGTAGAGWLRKYLAGTHAASMVKHSPCPILIVPRKTDLRKPQRIIYASDMLDVEKELISIIAFARLLDAWVHVLHVFPEKKHLLGFNSKDWLKRSRENCGYSKISFCGTAGTDIVEGINKCADIEKGDMLAVFSNRKSYAERLLMDSVSLEEALSARLPLLTLYKSD